MKVPTQIGTGSIASMVKHKYRLIPSPKRVVVWRTGADDEVSAMQVVEYAEKRPLKRSDRPGSSKPSISKGIVIHLWTVPLDGWQPEEFDFVHFVEDDAKIAYAAATVDRELEGWRWRLTCKESSVDADVQAQIQTLLSA